MLLAVPAAAQQPPITNPTPGCTATKEQLEQVRQAGIAFTTSQGAARVALADPSYKQHNPAFVKGAREAGMNDYDYFKSRFGGPAAARGGGAARAGGAPAGPQPPAAAPYEFAVAQCDTVFILRKQFRQDPTLPAGNFYEAYSFDAFRVRNGKLVEHWDMAVINPPAPAGGRGQ
jgi:hypothetical protein